MAYNAGASLTYQCAGGVLTNIVWSGAVTGRVGVALNADFRVTTLRVNGTNFASFKHDADGLLTNAGALVITRDPRSSLISGTALGNVTTTLQRNGFGEVTNYLAAFSGAPLWQMQYAYDQAGRITNKLETIQGATTQWHYLYDDGGRLQQVRRDGLVASSYTCDTNGNRRTWTTSAGATTYNYDVQDRLTDYAGPGLNATLQHTAAGEWSNRTVNGQATTYGYDEAGRIRQVILPDSTQVNYVLDAAGRRVSRKLSGVATNGWLWLGNLTVVAQLTGSNTVDTYFVPGSRPTLPEYLIKGTNLFRILADHLGSPRWVVNVADGTIVQRMDYDEFGRVTLDTNPGFQPFGFAGGLYDPATGLVRFGARDYDASTGQWTAKDPIGFAGAQTSLYAYVGNDPVNGIDRRGLGPGVNPQVEHAGLGGSVSGGAFGLGGTAGIQVVSDTEGTSGVAFTIGGGQSTGADLSATVDVTGGKGNITSSVAGTTQSVGVSVGAGPAGGLDANYSNGQLVSTTAHLGAGEGAEAHAYTTHTVVVSLPPPSIAITPESVDSVFEPPSSHGFWLW